ncbi:hypothetical protein Tco_0588250 [Tanacetum coccineum]
MSSPNHLTSNIEDGFSSNFPDYISASPDYVPASPGRTYSNSSNNLFVIMESLVKKKQKGAILELKRRHLKKVLKLHQCAVSSSSQERVLINSRSGVSTTPIRETDDPNITMEEYIQLMADKARGHGQTFNWEIATYDEEYYMNLGLTQDFETYFPTIVYNDAPTSNQNVSSEPTVSIFNAIKSDIDFHISFSDSEDEDYTFIYNKDPSSYKLIPSNDLKSEPVNDYVDINIESCSENIDDKPIDSVICIRNDTTPIEFDENIEINHDTSGINTAYPGDLAVNEIDSKISLLRVMSSPNHPTSNIEDGFSSNFPDYIPASLDYVPASPGRTYSNSSNNSFVIMESLVKKKQKGAILKLKRRHLKKVLKLHQYAVSRRKIRCICASSSQERVLINSRSGVSTTSLYAVCTAVHQSKICIKYD